jgi:ribulose 1,5-bisphosphate synthetase/thiazole synthase
VKPGSNLAAILASGTEDTKDFSKKDVVIVGGGD